jgi:hypothetical protein
MSIFSGKNLFAITIIISFLFILLIYLLPPFPAIKALFAVLALLIDIIAFSTKYYSYLLIPLIKMKNRTIVINSDAPFTLSPSGNTIIVRYGGMVYASAFIKIPIYKSATEMTPEERIDFSKAFSRVLTLSKSFVRFTTMLYVINKDEYLSEIRDKLNVAEERYNELNSQQQGVDQKELERAKGEVTMWRNLYENINKVRSNALGNFVMVTAPGGTEEEATTIALQQADELAAGISAVLGVSAYVMPSNEFMHLIEPEELIPFATITEQMHEKIASIGV